MMMKREKKEKKKDEKKQESIYLNAADCGGDSHTSEVILSVRLESGELVAHLITDCIGFCAIRQLQVSGLRPPPPVCYQQQTS